MSYIVDLKGGSAGGGKIGNSTAGSGSLGGGDMYFNTTNPNIQQKTNLLAIGIVGTVIAYYIYKKVK